MSIDYALTASRTVQAWEEANGRSCPEYGSTLAYVWHRETRENTHCGKCKELIPLGAFAIRRDYWGATAKAEPWHHVRCLDWRELRRFTQGGVETPAYATTVARLNKAVATPTFHLNLDPLASRVPLYSDYDGIEKLVKSVAKSAGVSAKFAQALVEKAALVCAASSTSTGEVEPSLEELERMYEEVA